MLMCPLCIICRITVSIVLETSGNLFCKFKFRIDSNYYFFIRRLSGFNQPDTNFYGLTKYWSILTVIDKGKKISNYSFKDVPKYYPNNC